MSKKDVALIHQVIPVHDLIRTHLEKIVDDTKLLKAIRVAASNGFEVDDKYYALTDDSNIYRVTMAMHPSYKLAYFKQQQWPEDWVEQVLSIVRKVWKEKYLPQVKPLSMKPVSGTADAIDEWEFGLHAEQSSADALELYLSTGTIPCTDPIAYWHAQCKSGVIPEALAKMALDYLSVPASSTDVKHAFSLSGRVVTPLCSSLEDESIRATVLLNSWLSIPGLVTEKVFKNHLVVGWKRGKNCAATQAALDAAEAAA
ncbi:hypothetical protein M422DRAFT_188910 [Sphaerobolus stellatus SS14]|uniref:HAT C-terminal dimerisation domain-containing protein n=1 Tax=Sphaerobolus stellatus (strain SS14) TaxID=990650 RepID=A0A0C9UJM9_SPHS4|nr:hypothetical protein M422DRAFT_188910 [Sphaerobolus stellatus SS14]